MNTGNTIHLDLTGDYVVSSLKGAPLASGKVCGDSGLQQLDAFLCNLRNALGDEEKNFCSGMASAIRYASKKAKKDGKVLTLDITSKLDVKNSTLLYSFSLNMGK